MRLLKTVAGAWLINAEWIFDDAVAASRWSDSLAGLVLIAMSLPHGKIVDRYGIWDRWVR
jgi:hypothetical protein